MAVARDKLEKLQVEFQSMLLKKLTGNYVNGDIKRLLGTYKSKEEQEYILGMCRNLNLGYRG